MIMNVQNEVEKRFLNLTNEQKNALLKSNKKRSLYANVVVIVWFSLLCFLFLFLSTITQTKNDKLLFIILGITSFVTGGAICTYLILSERKISDEKKIKKELKVSIKRENNKIKHDNFVKQINKELFIDDDIINVAIIDAYTEVSDKLHAILDFQEIIQTRYYKFKVDYKDGSSKIVTEQEGTTKCNNLLNLVNTNPNNTIKQQVDQTEELRKYKNLMDDGVITKEEFEQKKKQLLDLK